MPEKSPPPYSPSIVPDLTVAPIIPPSPPPSPRPPHLISTAQRDGVSMAIGSNGPHNHFLCISSNSPVLSCRHDCAGTAAARAGVRGVLHRARSDYYHLFSLIPPASSSSALICVCIWCLCGGGQLDAMAARVTESDFREHCNMICRMCQERLPRTFPMVPRHPNLYGSILFN